MGNQSVKQIEDGLNSNDDQQIEASCQDLKSLLEVSPNKDVDWPWVMYLLSSILACEPNRHANVIHTQVFHNAIRAMRHLHPHVARRDTFQTALCQCLTVRLVEGMFAAPSGKAVSLFVGTLKVLLGTALEEEDALDHHRPPRDGRSVERCGLYFVPWKRLLRSLVAHEVEWREREKCPSSGASQQSSIGPSFLGSVQSAPVRVDARDGISRAPAPLALLRGPMQYYQSEHALAFSLFLFHCFLTRESGGAEVAVVLGVLRDYMACCSADIVAKTAEAVVVGMDPNQQPLLAASNPFVRRVAMVLYDLALGTLQKPYALPTCRGAMACLPFFAPVLRDTTQLLDLVDACTRPYADAAGPDGLMAIPQFSHELLLALRLLRSHLITTSLPAPDWWRAAVALCAVFVAFRAHLLADHLGPAEGAVAPSAPGGLFGSPSGPSSSFMDASIHSQSPESAHSGVTGITPEASLAAASSSRAWVRLLSNALKCLHVLLFQPAAEHSDAHRYLAARLVAFLFINSREEYSLLMIDCLQILALKWERDAMYTVLCGAMVDEITHTLTLGSLLRHGANPHLRGGGAHLVSLLRADLRLSPKSVRPRVRFPDFSGHEVLDLETTPQLSLASWLLSHPAMAPFAKTVVGHRAQLFGQITVEGDPDPPDPALLPAEPTSHPATLLHFDGFSADFQIRGWSTSQFAAITNALLAPSPSTAQDYDAGAAFCEVLGTLAFTDFRWSGQPHASITDRYFIRNDGTCRVVLPTTLLAHPVHYLPLLTHASLVLTHLSRHLILKLSELLSVARGSTVMLATINRYFSEHNGSPLLSYIHREVLRTILERQDPDSRRLRREALNLRRELSRMHDDNEPVGH
jgi:hypothetical protein